ncbi:MAG: DegT/DnrJ/EryC1/StrS family aminotransferase [Verrucomicrobia bacterium]|nr:DegT/DnrJ/EryC1/StrS family aminotransferase [Verrucomicrobiota bacterium]
MTATPASTRIPCTGRVSVEGFADFLRAELGPSRQNLTLCAEEFGRVLGAEHVALVNSGSSANLAAAIWVKQRARPGRRRVLLAGFSFPTTISSFTLLGFEVELVDTEPGGFNLCPQALRGALADDVAAVVVTHFLGFPARLAEIAQLAHERGALLVQDACETMNLQVSARSIYAFGDIVTHSFYHPHHLTSFGGGAVVVRTREEFDHLQSIIHWGRECRCHYDPARCTAPAGHDHNFWYVREGVNLAMSELNACFARWQLQTWPEQEAARWARWQLWEEALRDLPGIQLWPARQNVSPFVFPIGVGRARFAATAEAVRAAGVEVRSLMGGAIHRHPAYRHLAHSGLTQCEEVGASAFFTGIHQTVPLDDVRRAAQLVREVLA